MTLFHRRPSHGFTLVEAMIAALIVFTMMIASLTLIAYLHLQNDLDQERARANQIVTGEMERVKHELYPRITGGTTVTVWDNGTPDTTADDTVGTLEVGIRTMDGTELSMAPVPAEVVQVEVTLSWHPRGRLHNKTFRETVMTFIAP